MTWPTELRLMSTRISGGKDRGRRLQLPRGRLRPTTERVRSAVFSILGDRVVGATVLDLYSGSGAMGLEALSRGALRADMVERDGRACSTIEANIRSLDYGDRATVMRARAESVVGSPDGREGCGKSGRDGGAYELVFIDPPYDDDPWETILSGLGEGSMLGRGAVVVAEHRTKLRLADSYGRLVRTSTRRYGDSSISMFTTADAHG